MELIAHPDHPPRAVTGVAVDVARAGDRLQLAYTITGDTKGLLVAPGVGRTDELWRRTCCEAFVQGVGPDYVEYNFASSAAWAAYGFADRRQGMHDLAADPTLAWADPTLRATVTVPITGDWRVNLAAVVAEADGTRSYWALAHPAGPPDFHDPACRVLELTV